MRYVLAGEAVYRFGIVAQSLVQAFHRLRIGPFLWREDVCGTFGTVKRIVYIACYGKLAFA